MAGGGTQRLRVQSAALAHKAPATRRVPPRSPPHAPRAARSPPPTWPPRPNPQLHLPCQAQLAQAARCGPPRRVGTPTHTMLADTLEPGNAATRLASRRQGDCQDFHKSERFSRRHLHWLSPAFWPLAVPASGSLSCLNCPWRLPVVTQVADSYEGLEG